MSKKYQRSACIWTLLVMIIWFILAEVVKEYEHIIPIRYKTHVGINNDNELSVTTPSQDQRQQWLKSSKDDNSRSSSGPVSHSFVLFAEAGKKKKKEKSEVIVISVTNPQSKGGHMYPVYIPTCGHGRKRRRRSIFWNL